MVYCTQCKEEVETETDEAHGYTCACALGSGPCTLLSALAQRSFLLPHKC